MTSADAPKQVLVGGSWLIGARAIDRLVGVVSISVLARLLNPSDFGVVAVAGTVVGAVELLSAFGFDWALVRHREPSADDLNSAWTLRLLFGLGTFVALALLGPAAAAFYRLPALKPVLVAMGAISFTGSLENIGTVYFRRDFAFHKEFLIRSAAKFGGFCASLTVALLYRSYWALVAGLFAIRAVTVAASYVLHPYRPRLGLKNARELFGFSSGLLFTSIIDYCRLRFGDLYIGRVYGAATNGLFAVAGEMAVVPLTEVSQPLGRAAYSRYAEDMRVNRGLGASYVSITSLIWMVTLPMAAGIADVAPAVIRLLLGPRWEGAVAVLRWMALGTGFWLMNANTHYVYWALGRTRIPAITSAAGAMVLIPATLVCSHFVGYVGVAAAFAITNALMVPITFTLLRRVAGIRFTELLPQVWRVILATLVMGLTLWYLFRGSAITGPVTAIRVLLGQVAVGLLTYPVLLYTTWLACGRPPGPEHLAERLTLRALGRRKARYAD